MEYKIIDFTHLRKPMVLKTAFPMNNVWNWLIFHKKFILLKVLRQWIKWMVSNVVFIYKLKTNMYNLSITVFTISSYIFKINRPDSFKTYSKQHQVSEWLRYLTVERLTRVELEQINARISHTCSYRKLSKALSRLQKFTVM